MIIPAPPIDITDAMPLPILAHHLRSCECKIRGDANDAAVEHLCIRAEGEGLINAKGEIEKC